MHRSMYFTGNGNVRGSRFVKVTKTAPQSCTSDKLDFLLALSWCRCDTSLVPFHQHGMETVIYLHVLYDFQIF